jgi:hypothetical protein
MARKKKINPLAAALTIAAIAAAGYGVWTYLIKPQRDKKRAASMGPVDSIPGEILDAQFEVVDEQTA